MFCLLFFYFYFKIKFLTENIYYFNLINFRKTKQISFIKTDFFNNVLYITFTKRNIFFFFYRNGVLQYATTATSWKMRGRSRWSYSRFFRFGRDLADLLQMRGVDNFSIFARLSNSRFIIPFIRGLMEQKITLNQFLIIRFPIIYNGTKNKKKVRK